MLRACHKQVELDADLALDAINLQNCLMPFWFKSVLCCSSLQAVLFLYHKLRNSFCLLDMNVEVVGCINEIEHVEQPTECCAREHATSY